ncbi:MAG: hypothetical protein L6R42_009042 [Xanthoria sp. 1 TBL-2021]|nr:MAG: hypothetical protein L6R42_009042 [Xanthoria sp. 1 TBL-2021]
MAASSAHPSPKSTYLTDPLLLPFLAPSFSATSYFNTTLPSPPSKTHANAQQQPQPTLSALASQTQFQISTLSAQTSRLSATLTALTDDILRCSSRLTYEIEVLRGEANGMAEALGERGELNEAIKTFVPDGLPSSSLNGMGDSIGNGASKRDDEDTTTTQHPQDQDQEQAPSRDSKQSHKTASATDPPITQLRTLLHVRASLTSITRTFSLALSWPMPPSLLPSSSSATSSLISITSPSSQTTTSSLETTGQTALANIKREIEEMLVVGDIEKARERVGELKACVEVWKGTGEEKARGKWVGEVEGWVEEVGGGMVRRGLVRGEGAGGGVGKGDGNGKDRVVGDEIKKGDGEKRIGGGGGGRGGVEPAAPARTGSGAGFLRRLRDEIYME